MAVLADLHAHVVDHYDITVPLLGGSRYMGIPNPEDLGQKGSLAKRLLEKCLAKPQNTLVGIANFDDYRAEGIIHDIVSEARTGYNMRYDGTMLSFMINDKSLCFIKVQEMETHGGHILIAGAKDNIKGSNLDRVVKSAK